MSRATGIKTGNELRCCEQSSICFIFPGDMWRSVPHISEQVCGRYLRHAWLPSVHTAQQQARTRIRKRGSIPQSSYAVAMRCPVLALPLPNPAPRLQL